MQTQENYKINAEEFVIFAGEETGSNLVESLKFTQSLSKRISGSNVLYINTVQSEKRLMQSIHEYADAAYKRGGQSDKIHYLTNTLGDISRLVSTFEYYLNTCNCRVIVINAWEFCASDYRQREQLVYLIRSWRAMGITVILYSQMFKREPKAGRIERGGLGKLAGTADQIISLAVPLPQPDEVTEATQAAAVTIGDEMADKKPSATASVTSVIYFETDPHERGAESVTMWEDTSEGDEFARNIELSEYNFPEVTPTLRNPEDGTIDEYLARYKKPLSSPILSDKRIEDYVGVKNDLVAYH